MERIERDVILDTWNSVDADVALSLRIAHLELGGAALVALGRFESGLFNRAHGLGCAEAVSEAGAGDVFGWLRRHCAPAWRVQFVPVAASDGFDERASALGPAYEGLGSAKMYRDASPLSIAEVETTLDVRPVTCEHASACLQTCAYGFGLPSTIVTALVNLLIGRPRWHVYAAYDGDDPVAFGLTFVDRDWAWLGWGSTLPTHRGRGAQSALLRRRLADGLALGGEHFAIECAAPSECRATGASYRNIVRAGFSEVYTRPAYGPA